MPKKRTAPSKRKSAFRRQAAKPHFRASLKTGFKGAAARGFSSKPGFRGTAAKRPQPKKSRPDIRVKKSTYSKAVRASVLVSANARQRLIEMGGENTIDIIREFDQDMSDEELARKTGIKASDVRVVLNRLHSQGLFSYTRVRDRDSGWYSYIWKMSEPRLREFVEGAPSAAGGEETKLLEGETYRCPACSPEKLVGFGEATDARFKCAACGADLEFYERKAPLAKPR